MSTGRRFNVMFARHDEGKKTRWARVGIAFEKSDRQITLKLDAIPLNFDGRLYLFLRDEAERELEPHEVRPPRHQAGEPAAAAAAVPAPPTALAQRARPGHQPDGTYLTTDGVMLPRGYTPKVHKTKAPYSGKGLCDRYSKNRTDDWAKVTCRNCRALAPKGTALPPLPPEGEGGSGAPTES